MSPEDLPVRIVHYEDPVEGFRGFLAYNGTSTGWRPVAVG
jgi:hypothetical protein